MSIYLSGIQPTGELHIGNYFGAIKQHLDIQHKVTNKRDALFFVANYHALTNDKIEPDELKNNSFKVAATYLALGLDPTKCALFLQSDVPEVTELASILANVVGMGVLQRCHAYITKVENGITPNVGLFTYPILMAADILIYDSDYVPVGQDQIQHIELAKDIAQSFNSRYGEVFKLPNALISSVPKVPGVDGRKMSKSYNNTIPILTSDKELKSRVMSIKTDSTDYKTTPLDPDNCNVYALYCLFATDTEKEEMRFNYIHNRAFGYGHAKIKLLEKIKEYFAGARKDLLGREYTNNGSLVIERTVSSIDYIESVLRDGAQIARQIAQEKIKQVRKTIGLD